MRNGEVLPQSSSKPLMCRVPPKEIQGSWHTSGSDQPKATNGSHRGFWSVFCVWQPSRGDQDHGHSTEEWELGWSDPWQDCSMHHCRDGHWWQWVDTLGICSPSLSCVFCLGVYPCRRIATTSCILVWGFWSDTAYGLHFGEAGKAASSLVLIYLEMWGSVLRGYLEFL